MDTIQTESLLDRAADSDRQCNEQDLKSANMVDAQLMSGARIVKRSGFGGRPDLVVPALSLNDWMVAAQHDNDAAKLAFAKRMDFAFGHYGFAAIVDHGIAPEILENAYAAAEAFFVQSTEEKAKWIVPGALGQRGYTPDGETAKGASVPDYKEFVQIGRADNPTSKKLPQFLTSMTALMASFDRIGDALLSALSLFETGNERLLPEAVINGRSILRAIHYPPLDASVPAFSERAAAHEDINLITLLLSARTMGPKTEATGQGLQLKVPTNGKRAEVAAANQLEWVNAIVPKDALIINVGEMLERWTNGAWRATTHRVINPLPGHPERLVSRLSMPFFVHPRPEFSLTPHTRSIARAGGVQHYESVTADQALNERLRELRQHTEPAV